jgi:hypothetical protein
MTTPQLPYTLRRYCANCWESLTPDGKHRDDQPCTDPSAPLSYTELNAAIKESLRLTGRLWEGP